MPNRQRRRARTRNEDPRVRIAEINARVSRHVAILRVLPVVVVSAATVTCTYLAGAADDVRLELDAAVITALLTLAPLGAGMKYWDRRQKRRQRAIIQSLEAIDEEQVEELDKLRLKVAQLQGQLREARLYAGMGTEDLDVAERD